MTGNTNYPVATRQPTDAQFQTIQDDLVAAYGRLPKLCGYVHLPMQSGSDRILRAMNRPYTRDRYRAIVDALRAVQPGMYLSTDVIVGFPGETEADFADTCGLFEACDFDMAYVFKYSIRTGTPAAALGDAAPVQATAEQPVAVGLGARLAAQCRLP